jgi:hypothetical protein
MIVSSRSLPPGRLVGRGVVETSKPTSPDEDRAEDPVKLEAALLKKGLEVRGSDFMVVAAL